MKLEQLLETLDPEQLIKIGAKDGSSFFYVGTPADMLATFDTSSKCYGEYDNVIFKAYGNSLKKWAEILDSLYDAAVEAVREDNHKGLKVNLKKLFKSELASKIAKTESKYEEIQSHMKQTKPLRDRTVREHFKADDVADEWALAIIVDGFEYGRYWTMDEGPKGFGGRIKPSIKLNNVEA